MAVVLGRVAGVLGLVCAVAAGCVAAPATAPPPVARAGATVFRLDDHLGFPYEATEIELFVDGRPVASRRAPLPESTWLGQVELPPGRHAFVLRAVVAFASDLVGGRCAVRLREMRIFEVSGEPAVVRLTLHERGVTYDFPSRVALALRLDGARLVPLATVRADRDAERACDGAGRAEQILCRTRVRVDRAEASQDASGPACLAPKLASVSSLADVRRRWLDQQRIDPHAESPAGDPAAMVLLTERRMETLWASVEQCAAHHGLELDESSRVVEGEGCAETAATEGTVPGI
jgi:hypothetical protein